MHLYCVRAYEYRWSSLQGVPQRTTDRDVSHEIGNENIKKTVFFYKTQEKNSRHFAFKLYLVLVKQVIKYFFISLFLKGFLNFLKTKKP